MNFWERVEDLLEKKDINKKTLAFEAGFDASNITKGIKKNNIPSAETALKIAQFLNVSIEYLINGAETPSSPTQEASQQNQLRLYRKYQHLITSLENFSPEKQQLVKNLIQGLERI